MSYTKYYVYKEQVSNDGGQTWEYTGNEKPDGEPIGHYETLEECEGYVPPSPYEAKYLTFVAQGTTSSNMQMFSFSRNLIYYSLDSGATWVSLHPNAYTPTVFKGQEIWWKQTGLTPSADYGIGTFSSSGNFEVKGNIMSLYYWDNFADKKDLTGKDYAFRKLFSNCSLLKSIDNLVLPVTTLSNGCYERMFYGCQSLTTTPQNLLPVTTLTEHCYREMFYLCTSLRTAPELPATTLTESCYERMFGYCMSLNNIKCLATSISATSCTSSWVNNVASTGTFVTPSSTSWATGIHGIPQGWTRVNA